MPSLVSLPFLKPSQNCVELVAWTLPNGDQLPEEWPGWDPTVDLDISVAVEVNINDVLRECQLENTDAQLLLATTWRSGGTTLKGRGEAYRLGGSGTDRTVLQMVVSGSELMGDVELNVQLVLADVPGNRTALSPWRAGSILWTSSRKILLGGTGGRFPIEWTAFGESGQFHVDSGWQLDWNPEDLDVPALAGIRLYMNSSNAPLEVAVESGGVDPLMKFMHFDVARTLITGILGNPEFGLREHEPESVGSVMLRLITAVFPGEDIAAIRDRMTENRARFESELQGRLRLMVAEVNR